MAYSNREKVEKEVVVVKLMRRRKVKQSYNFSNYENALDFAIRKGYIGYDSLILRLVDGRWYKVNLYSDEPR